MGYTNSPLVSYTKISPNKTVNRNHEIDTVTIHCYVGQASVESAGSWFGKITTMASCNYMIGSDGRIALIVEEKDRSWCTSNKANDHRAVTIECACDKTHPYAVNDNVYESLINLVADICKRNNIKKLLWKNDKTLIGEVDKQNMTVHQWFKNKSCPGEYLLSRHSDIANKVNEKLGVVESSVQVPFSITVNNVKKNDVLNIRKEPNADSAKTGQLAYNDKNTYTIIEVKNGWGRLKSKIGWINLSYTKTVTTTSKPATSTPVVKPVVQPVQKPVASTPKPEGNPIVKKGQQHAINFTGVKIDVDGIVGNDTNKMKKRVLQHALNLDYGKTLKEDGLFQTKSKLKLGSHYVKKGERQYLVSAAEILMELHGIDPNGVEMPGKYGNGLVKAAKKFFGDEGTKITASEFLRLIQ